MVRSVPSEPVNTIAGPSERPPTSWFSSAATMLRQRPVDQLRRGPQIGRRVERQVESVHAETVGDLGDLQQDLTKLARVRDRPPRGLLDQILGIGAPHR